MILIANVHSVGICKFWALHFTCIYVDMINSLPVGFRGDICRVYEEIIKQVGNGGPYFDRRSFFLFHFVLETQSV